MSLDAKALTTMDAARLYIGLYTATAVTATETLTAMGTACDTFQIDNNYIVPGTIADITETTATASDTLATANLTIDYELGTIQFSATMTGTITISGYTYNLFDYSNDWFIERRINAVSALVRRYCNRDFVADTYAEFYAGLASQYLMTNQYPINAITSVSVESAALTAGTDYVTSDATLLEQGFIFRGVGWPFCGHLTGLVGELTGPEANIEVVYSAGYTAIPADLENAVLEMVAEDYEQHRDGTAGLKKLTQGKLTYEWTGQSRVDEYADVLNLYRRW